MWLRERAAKELDEVKSALAGARRRRKLALQRARLACRKARLSVREQIKAYRSEELKRINRHAAEMRNAARAQCQARKHRIQSAGARALERKVAELRAEQELQRRLSRAARVSKRLRNTARERLQESDDAVRSNLPHELRGVFERVKRHIKGNRRRTRTEEFLEWAQEHPEDVLEYQGDETDREVRRLIAEHEAAERRLAKTSRAARRRAAGDDDGAPF